MGILRNVVDKIVFFKNAIVFVFGVQTGVNDISSYANVNLFIQFWLNQAGKLITKNENHQQTSQQKTNFLH